MINPQKNNVRNRAVFTSLLSAVVQNDVKIVSFSATTLQGSSWLYATSRRGPPLFEQVWSYRSGQAARSCTLSCASEYPSLRSHLHCSIRRGHGRHGCRTKRPHHAPLCEPIGDLPSPSAVTKSPKQVVCRIGAPFALHHLSVPAARIWRPLWSGFQHSCPASDKSRFAGRHTHGQNLKACKHRDPSRIQFSPRPDRWALTEVLEGGANPDRDMVGNSNSARSSVLREGCLRRSQITMPAHARARRRQRLMQAAVLPVGAAEHRLGLSRTVSSFPNIQRFSVHEPQATVAGAGFDVIRADKFSAMRSTS
ncbi:hypothetical protein RGR602_PB00261 (plasmid) [Rhizobium gallicum bv. gallicum R602sp]|uniref:Uncharacterized protein n=1 Tax=Rhizobium gallicum bv. gallicum R602sp TaxID=1041138 RepID=A0A0B4X9J1_9HYPH|nr:hypothetical protein RGR602_PB00261 [Rhizobium gallicum bv. gallicum R602sp]